MSYTLSLSRQYVRILFLITVSTIIVSCGSSRKTIVTGADARPTKESTSTKAGSHNSYHKNSQPLQSLLSEADTWKGTPYLWGGNDRNGVDCSGFVTQVFKNALGIKLPRTSKTQSEYCTPLKRKDLQPGDLVFFATNSKKEGEVSHVGLYIGDGNMIHSSSSRGVIVSSLDNNYYRKTFHSAGRVEPLQAMIKEVPEHEKIRESTPADIIIVGTIPATSPEVASINPAKTKDSATKNNNTRRADKVKTKKPIPTKKKTESVASQKKREITTASAPTATTDDARLTFLNSIIEEKVDSIFSY